MNLLLGFLFKNNSFVFLLTNFRGSVPQIIDNMSWRTPSCHHTTSSCFSALHSLWKKFIL